MVNHTLYIIVVYLTKTIKPSIVEDKFVESYELYGKKINMHIKFDYLSIYLYLICCSQYIKMWLM